MVKKLALVALCVTSLSGTALAQDAKTVIANAQKALGDPQSRHLFRVGEGRRLPAVWNQRRRGDVPGTHDPMRPINNYVRVVDLTTPASRHTGATNNPVGGGRRPGCPERSFSR